MKRKLSKYPIIKEYNVMWGEMDSALHVNNVVYLRWAESVRIAYFEAMQMDVSYSGMDVGPILGWQDCKYIFSLTYPDVAICGARTVEIKEDRIIMECVIFSQKHQRIAALSNQSIIPYHYKELKKVELPEKWKTKIDMLEG